MMRRERGTALLLVLWATVLLAALLAGVAAAARSHSQAALYGAQRVRAKLAATAGLAQAVAGLHAPERQRRWVPDGRRYRFAFDGAKVTVAVVDVSGLVDLNTAAPAELAGVFAAAGAGGAQARQLVNAVEAQHATLSAQGRGPFRSIDQLARLPGMNRALFAKVEPALTVFSGRVLPDPSYTGPLALAALRGIGLPDARALVRTRRARPALPGTHGGRPAAVAGGPLLADYGGTKVRVFSVAQMPDGTRVGLDATLRMTSMSAQRRPYQVLAWRAGPTHLFGMDD